jgi:hypothetical protein
VSWVQNEYKGFRDEENGLYVGMTPSGRWWRVWQRGADGFIDTRRPFPSAAAAKQFAESLVPLIEAVA